MWTIELSWCCEARKGPEVRRSWTWMLWIRAWRALILSYASTNIRLTATAIYGLPPLLLSFAVCMFVNTKGWGTGNYLTSVAKQAKTAFLHGPTVWKSPIVGIEPATFRSESAALTTAPRDTVDRGCTPAPKDAMKLAVFFRFFRVFPLTFH